MSQSEEALLQRLRAGDRTACADCIEQYGSHVYHLALRLMKNEADAEDVLQETFLSAFQAIDDFEGRSSLSTWLYRITYNTAMIRLRRRQTQPPLPVEETLQEEATIPRQLFDWCCLPEQELTSDEVRTILEEALQTLSPALRAAFVLREMEGLSTAETAAILDVSTAAVKKRLQRARLELREQLSDYFAAQNAPSREASYG